MTDFFLRRKIFTDESTIGDIYFDGEFVCSSLERSVRRISPQGIIAIPAGTFEVIIFQSPKFGRLMPQLVNVPGRTAIDIHWGNKAADSLGCILTGDFSVDVTDWVSHSRAEFEKLFALIQDALTKGKLFLSILGGPNA